MGCFNRKKVQRNNKKKKHFTVHFISAQFKMFKIYNKFFVSRRQIILGINFKQAQKFVSELFASITSTYKKKITKCNTARPGKMIFSKIYILNSFSDTIWQYFLQSQMDLLNKDFI